MKHALIALAIAFCSLSLFAAEQNNYPFALQTEREGNNHRIVARNHGAAPVSVKVSIADSRNIAPDRPFPLYAVVPPDGATHTLASIGPRMTGTGYNFRTQSSWMLGDYHARQSPTASYRLPYGDGLAFHIGQAAGGPLTTHSTPDSHYAVDIGMPEGTPVVAARDGIVVYTEAKQTYGGKNPDLMSKANAVRILHSDGTIAIYAHLAHGGVKVYPGQRVKAGMQIGLSGSTGYSSGPHLHFAVQTVVREGASLNTVALPFQFYVGNPPASFAPRFGMFARADYSSPGKVPSASPGAYKARASRSRAEGGQ